MTDCRSYNAAGSPILHLQDRLVVKLAKLVNDYRSFKRWGETWKAMPRTKPALSQILQVNSMLTMGREVAAPDIAERADDFEYHCRKAEAPVEG